MTTRPAHPAELEALLCFDLYAASRAVTGVYRPILAPLGLTYPQYLVLVVLWQRQECSIKELSETLRLDHGTLTPLLRRMEVAGHLTRRRSADDERSVVVTLAPAGAALQVHVPDIQCRIEESLGLTGEQVDQLQGLLRTVAEARSGRRAP